jgi:hypothetical protein
VFTMTNLPPPPTTTATRTNGLAVASLVLGIVGILLELFGVIPILAITFGVVARRQIAQGRGTGRGMATAGIVLGVIGLVVLLVILAAYGANPSLFQRH